MFCRRPPVGAGARGAGPSHLLLAPLLLFVASACTLTLDTSPTQCRRTQDCAKFSGSVCDLVARVCRPGAVPATDSGANAGNAGASSGGAPGGSSGGDGATGGDGGGGGASGSAGSAADMACRIGEVCAACASSSGPSLQNRCTDVTCVSFDNKTRLAHSISDGGLLPLPQ